MNFSASRMLAYGALALGLGYAAYQLCQTKKEEPAKASDESHEHITQTVKEIMARFPTEPADEILNRDYSLDGNGYTNDHLTPHVLSLLEKYGDTETSNTDNLASPQPRTLLSLKLHLPTTAKGLVEDDDI